MILWTVFVFTFLVASLPSNIAYILVFFLADLGFLTVAASYFAKADGHAAAAVALQKSGGVFCFPAGLIGWYIIFFCSIRFWVCRWVILRGILGRKGRVGDGCIYNWDIESVYRRSLGGG